MELNPTRDQKGSGPCLVVENLSKDFGGLRAVDGVNLTIEPGERRVLMGPNGAGKTTFFNMISGVYPASSREDFLFRKGHYPVASLPSGRTGYGEDVSDHQPFP